MGMPMPTHQNVFSVLELSVKNQQEQAGTIALMFEAIKQTVQTVQEAESRISISESRIQSIADKIDREVRLFPSEVGELFQAVVRKSNSEAKLHKMDTEEGYPVLVGRIRRKIWSELKKRYSVSKYIEIPRKDFEDAMDFVERFNIADYV